MRRLKDSTCIPDVDFDSRLVRSRITEAFKPSGNLASATTGVDHQICFHFFRLFFAFDSTNLYSGDPRTIRRSTQAGHRTLLENLYVGFLLQAATQVRLQKGPTLPVRDEVRCRPCLPDSTVIPAQILGKIADNGPFFDKFIKESGEQLVDHADAATKHNVNTFPLRYPFPRFVILGKRVVLKNGNLLKMVPQHARRQQPANAAANHDRMFSQRSV